MPGPITSGAHPKALWPGVHDFFGMVYDEYAQEYTMIFDVLSSGQSYEEDVQSTNFGLVPIKAEGEATRYDSHQQGWVKRYTNVAYSMGYIVTKEELDDNLYRQRSFPRARMLAYSLRQTEETVGANVLNRGFNTAYVGGDGKPLFATDHPSLGGDYSNKLPVDADLSETALEDLLIIINTAKDFRGNVIRLLPQHMIVHPNDQFNAARILKSILQNDTANNAVNAIRAMNALPGGFVVNHYLTDTDAWFIKTNCPNGMQWFNRKSQEFTQDNDFDTENAKAKVYRRFSNGWTDPKGMYGSAGA